MKHIQLRPVTITAKRVEDDKVQATPESEEAAQQQIHEEIEQYRNKGE